MKILILLTHLLINILNLWCTDIKTQANTDKLIIIFSQNVTFWNKMCCCVDQSVPEGDMVLTAGKCVTVKITALVTEWRASVTVLLDTMGISVNMVRKHRIFFIEFCILTILVSFVMILNFYFIWIKSMPCWFPWSSLPASVWLPCQCTVWSWNGPLPLSSRLQRTPLW